MNWKHMPISSWGRLAKANVKACRPERTTDIVTAMGTQNRNGIIAYGCGRSYGDVALNDGGQILLTERLNRFIDFDENTGDLVCESGVTYKDLCETFLPRGYVAPVSPGTSYVSLGGAIANDVHGKNHDKVGSIGNHIRWMEIILPSGEKTIVSRTQNADIFAATIGGLGLTGIIHKLCLRMQKASAFVEVHERRIDNIENFFTALQEHREKSTYTVGWIDGSARGRNLGRGIFMNAELIETDKALPPLKKKYRIPFNLPGFILNPQTVNLFNKMYFNHIPKTGRNNITPLIDFLYPLDAIEDWNRCYGKKGFYQFQCVLPDDSAFSGIKMLLEYISKQRSASFLSVIKSLGSQGEGFLSFPIRGITLALDFPNRNTVQKQLSHLEKIVVDFGGRVYLAKDANLNHKHLNQMYPKLKSFIEVIERIDPTGKMQSDLARRLHIRKYR